MGDSVGLRTGVTLAKGSTSYHNDMFVLHSGSVTFLDMVPLTGDIVYSIRVANSYYAGATTYINQVADEADGSWSQRGISTLTAITLRNTGIDSVGLPGPRDMTGHRGEQGE